MIFVDDTTGRYLMPGPDIQQAALFSYLTLERRIPADHPLRSIRRLIDRALVRINGELDKLYSGTKRESIPPERSLRSPLLMVPYAVRSERQLMEQLNYNLLFPWFVGLEMATRCGTRRCSARTGSG
jgi:transposase